MVSHRPGTPTRTGQTLRLVQPAAAARYSSGGDASETNSPPRTWRSRWVEPIVRISDPLRSAGERLWMRTLTRNRRGPSCRARQLDLAVDGVMEPLGVAIEFEARGNTNGVCNPPTTSSSDVSSTSTSCSDVSRDACMPPPLRNSGCRNRARTVIRECGSPIRRHSRGASTRQPYRQAPRRPASGRASLLLTAAPNRPG